MNKTEQLYEGKAKKVWATEDPTIVIVDYKDDATAFNGLKKGTIVGKGVVNNKMSNYLMQLLEKHGVPTHFVEELSDRETAVKKVTIVPLDTFTIPSVFIPMLFASRSAARLSAVSPDWLIIITRSSLSNIGFLYLNSDASSTLTGILAISSMTYCATMPTCHAEPQATI